MENCDKTKKKPKRKLIDIAQNKKDDKNTSFA
jgi:hypothetical protein